MHIFKETAPPLQLKSITLFTTALCNLSCDYCYICKADKSVFNIIDNDIAFDWDNDIYIKRLKSEFTENQLKDIGQISLWGGEPFIKLNRFTDNFDKFFDTLPNLENIDFSTNLVSSNCIDKLKQLIDVMDRRVRGTGRKMSINCQISVDGPPEINDVSRGNGVTQKIIDNYIKLLDMPVPDNILMCIMTKPTLSVSSFDYFDSYDNVVEYYQFFVREFGKPFKNRNLKNVSLFLGIPNYAEPYTYTKEDGIRLANNYRVIQKVSQTVDFENYFRGESLIPYATRYCLTSNEFNTDSRCVKSCGGGCGKLTQSVTMTPKGMYSVCHRGLFDSYIDYVISRMNNPINESGSYDTRIIDMWNWDYETHKQVMKNASLIYQHPHSMTSNELDVNIKLHAMSGLIDKQYLDDSIRKNAVNVLMKFPVCYYANLIVTGSLNVQPHTERLLLLLNGALDVILEEQAIMRQRRNR